MSGMNNNPYAEELEGYVDPRNSLETSALLALAYEQRTANLIAALALEEGGYTFARDANAAAVVQERLGL